MGDISKLSNTLQINQWVKQEIKRKDISYVFLRNT